jgi:hypothetical protein
MALDGTYSKYKIKEKGGSLGDISTKLNTDYTITGNT